ncbi:divergent PAP2 family protein [[Clostridium] symbiosum ATCC 14940]|nr:divergent PAP2 family protein [[Clostridium] symbiosum ATCC 14940]
MKEPRNTYRFGNDKRKIQEINMTFFQQVTGNQTLMSGVAGWVIAQVLKTLLDIALNRSFNPERIFGSGGMPSSHSSTMCALTTAAGMRYGGGSFEFAVCFIMSMVVMYDAIGVRQETGKQAKVLNRLLFDDFLKLDGVVLQEKLKEYVGHTPIQVAAGAILGVIIAVVMDPMFI